MTELDILKVADVTDSIVKLNEKMKKVTRTMDKIQN